MIANKCEPLSARLEEYGVSRVFSEAFLVFEFIYFTVFNWALSSYSLHIDTEGVGVLYLR
jgi:hypothetical protein